jgi:DNA-directed RNA polymerase subunit RPC12/RpoP
VSGRLQLQCPNGCVPAHFEALNAPLFVDANGRYLEHDSKRATYVCATCASVAVDVAAAARQMVRDRTAAPPTLVCPACATEMLPPDDDPLATHVECPACGVQFAVEEGMPRLHGGGA